MGQKQSNQNNSLKEYQNKASQENQEQLKSVGFAENVNLKLPNYLSAAAINFSQTFLIAGIENTRKIIVYSLFCKERQIKIIRYTRNNINFYQLKFFKNSNQFILISYTSFDIWCLDERIKLQDSLFHYDLMSGMEINEKENLIISGTYGCKIYFWEKDNLQWLNSQTLQLQGKSISSLSLNEGGDKLISLCSTNTIFVIQKGKNNVWVNTQKIAVEQSDLLFFISNFRFGNVPNLLGLLQFFECNVKSDKFKIIKLIHTQEFSSDSTLFPIKSQFNKKKSILFVNLGWQCTFYRLNENLSIETLQQIKFKNQVAFGCWSAQGDFFVTCSRPIEYEEINKYKIKIFKNRG